MVSVPKNFRAQPHWIRILSSLGMLHGIMRTGRSLIRSARFVQESLRIYPLAYFVTGSGTDASAQTSTPSKRDS